jgi:hypothetical protein
MEKNNKADKLIEDLSKAGQLDEVPTDISKRFHETLSSLVLQESHAKKKTSWFTSGSQYALAASFALVFAIGAVITLDSGGQPNQPALPGQTKVTDSQPENNATDDQLLYSAGEDSLPETSNSPIRISNSAHDYQETPAELPENLGVGITWNSGTALESSLLKCLKSLELDKSTNLIDTGFLNKAVVKAIWTPISSNSWNVYLLDADCTVLDKKFIQE